MVSEESGLLGKMRGYASAGLISAGPWIITMTGLSIVGLAYTGASARDDTVVSFLALMTYVFSFSLLTVSGLQMTFTRWLADTLYAKNYDRVVPGFVVALTAVAVVQAPVALGFCLWAGYAAELTLALVSLYVIVSLTWVTLIWLTVIRQYERILIAFAAGVGVFWVALHAFRPSGELTGTITAYAVGSGVTLALMIGLVMRGVESARTAEGGAGGTGVAGALGVLRSPWKYPGLMAAGMVYGLAIWIDKYVFWFTAGVEAIPFVWSHPLYDSCFFLAYLSVVPALTINLVHLETSFYEKYRAYYSAILSGFPLDEIDARRFRMVAELRRGATKLLRTQGAVTVLAMIGSGPIVRALGMPDFAERVLRFALLGAFFQVLFLITLLIQLYFDLRKEALWSSVAFLGANTALAVWSVSAGPWSYGIGYTVASLFGAVVAFVLLDRSVARLTYRTFTRHAHSN